MPSTKIEFHNREGITLAARFDQPEGAVRAYALFAHCFTCSKDSLAASRIAKGLMERGIGVLRFDFTGLGESGGGVRFNELCIEHARPAGCWWVASRTP